VADFCRATGDDLGAGFIAWVPVFVVAATNHVLATLLRGGTVLAKYPSGQAERKPNRLKPCACVWRNCMRSMRKN